MKTTILYFNLCFAFLFFTLEGYTQNLWQGGTPGKETDWETAKNWSQNRVPDWTQDVIIPDVSSQSGYFPAIKNIAPPIPHLKIYSNAILTIMPEGSIIIDGSVTFNSGILLQGKIISKGEIIITKTALIGIDEQGGQLIFENKNIAGN